MTIAYTVIACASLIAVDGDTIRCDGETMRLLGSGAPYVSGVDWPEVERKCLAERMLAQLAGKRLQELLSQPDVTVESSVERDSTLPRRLLVRVRLEDGRFAGQGLIEEGYAVEWSPGKIVDWCAPRPTSRLPGR